MTPMESSPHRRPKREKAVSSAPTMSDGTPGRLSLRRHAQCHIDGGHQQCSDDNGRPEEKREPVALEECQRRWVTRVGVSVDRDTQNPDGLR